MPANTTKNFKQTEKMTKTIIALLLIFLGSIGISYGQFKINGGIYSDSTLTEPLKKVKLILKSENSKKIYWTDKKGKFNISIETDNSEYSLEIKKKGYISIILEGISKDKTFDVILRKSFCVDDKEYDGVSEIIMRN